MRFPSISTSAFFKLWETDILLAAFSAEAISELGVTNYRDLSGFAPNVLMHQERLNLPSG